MATLIVPRLDDEPWPTLGPQVCDLLEERSIFGPGSLKGNPYEIDAEGRAAIYRAYEVFPQWHHFAGRRRFKRVGISWRKGMAKTEKGAQITFAELHPEGPVRCDGFDAYGQPVGRPVRDPYIPMLAVAREQVEELAFGALYVICTEGPDADLFDASMDRIVRLDERGRPDGKAVPLSNSPGARDGARTTFQMFDEPHRLYLPRQIDAHETMVANLEKRVLEDPWGLYVGTAGQPGQESVAEGLHIEAELIERGKIDAPQLFYFHREAGPDYDLTKLDDRIRAVAEATGPVGEFGPGQFESIARQWDRPKADKSYLERVWLNRWTQAARQYLDPGKLETLRCTEDVRIPDGAFVTVGFDGARFKDATGFVVTDIETGIQAPFGLWERTTEDGPGWEVPIDEVNEVFDDIMERFVVWQAYPDPPHYVETVAEWANKHPDQVTEWWTLRRRPMYQALQAYLEAVTTDSVSYASSDAVDVAELLRHLGNAGKAETNLTDETGEKVYILGKLAPERKFDLGMAAVLSWRARLDAIKAGAEPPADDSFVPVRVR